MASTLSCLALSALLSLSPRSGDISQLSPFVGSLQAAQEEARQRNVPLIVAFVQAGEEANERFRDGILPSAAFAAVAADGLLLLANDGAHPQKVIKEKLDGKTVERSICAGFGTPTCEEHRRHCNHVYQQYSEEGVLNTPQVIFIRPDGEVHSRVKDVPDSGVQVYATHMKTLLALIGPGISAEALIQIRVLLSAARGADRLENWLAAHRAWGEILSLAPVGAYADEAKAGLERAFAGLVELLAEALSMLEAGEVRAGYERLLALREQLVDSPLEDQIKTAIKQVERKKEWREIVERVKNERAAAELLSEVDALLAADEERKALKLLRKLLRKYPDTPAERMARRRHAGLVEQLES